MRCAIAMWPRCNAVARGRTVPEQGCGKRSRLADNTCSSYLLSRMYRAYIRHRGIMSCQRQPRCSAKQLVAGLREYRREPVRVRTLICSAKRIRKFVEGCTKIKDRLGSFYRILRKCSAAISEDDTRRGGYTNNRVTVFVILGTRALLFHEVLKRRAV